MSIKVVIRGSDVGYSQICDDGFFDAVDNGLVTSANVMLDGRSAKNALTRLRERPWISIEWHRQLWGWPILVPDKVPSLVNEEGRFKWGHKNRQMWNEVNYEEAYAEFEAELNMCFEYCGRYPTMTAGDIEGEILNIAFRDVCDKYNIPINLFHSPFYPIRDIYENSNFIIRAVNPSTDCVTKEEVYKNWDLNNIKDYDPTSMILNSKFEDGKDYLISIHPGFVDDIILSESSMTLHRIKENICAKDDRVRNWIKNNGYILSNTEDVINGTSNYQKYLKKVGSDLYMG